MTALNASGLYSVTIKQVADEVLVKCSCGQGIQLQDSNGTNKKAIKDINKSFKDLENTFKKLGRWEHTNYTTTELKL